MDTGQLFEDEASDSFYREKALEAFRNIRDWLANNIDDLPHLMMRSSNYGGSYMLPTSRVGLPYDDLYITFAPSKSLDKQGYELGASFGVIKTDEGNAYVILMPVLKGSYNTDFLNTRFGFRKTEFVHEFMHFWMRRFRNKTKIKGSTRALDTNDISGYFNNPDETDAYYQEGAQVVLDVCRSLIKARDAGQGVLKRLNSMSIPELAVYFKNRCFNKTFIQYADEKSTRAFNKRFIRFLVETVKPLIQSALDNPT